MNRLVFAFLVLLAPAVSAAEIVKIGSWNIEHLGSRTPSQKPEDLAEHVELMGVDLLGLIEIDDTDPSAARKNSKLDAAFTQLNAGGRFDWKYELFPNRIQNDESQLVGIAWNEKRVQKIGSPLRLAITPDVNPAIHLWDRHPHATKFQVGSGNTDFVVIIVHMKANVPTATIGRNQRRKESLGLVAQLPAVRSHFNDQDIVVLGDTNILSATEDSVATLEGAGLRMLNEATGTFVGTNSPAFDRIFVPDQQPEFGNSRQYILTPSAQEAHNELLSDHFGILTTVRIVADDDP